MKNFLLNVLATVVGIIVFLLIVGIFGIMSIVGHYQSKRQQCAGSQHER